jgi:3-deoxy-manno-octulosonate cytidylyltransferase (CMP-KDO synthetase)
MRHATIIIPARWASTRFPGKPLTPITGATGITKPLIQRTWEVAQDTMYQGIPGDEIDNVYIATDSIAIADACRAFGARVIMTSSVHANGTERCAQAAAILGLRPDDVVINLQGDALMTLPEHVAAIGRAFGSDPHKPQVATLVMPVDGLPVYGDVQAVLTEGRRVAYFSRAAIPFIQTGASAPKYYQHIGVYGYRESALNRYINMWPGAAEQSEQLEQLRFIENDTAIQAVEAIPHRRLIEVNTPEDVARVEAELVKWNIE